MGIRVFASKLLSETMPEDKLQSLMVEFKEYKKTGIAPGYFGRDVPYHRPHSVQVEDMHHLHLREGVDEIKWNLKTVQFRKVSDTHLVYCRGENSPDCYLLICIMNEAHEKANKVSYMLSLAEIAESFRLKY